MYREFLWWKAYFVVFSLFYLPVARFYSTVKRAGVTVMIRPTSHCGCLFGLRWISRFLPSWLWILPYKIELLRSRILINHSEGSRTEDPLISKDSTAHPLCSPCHFKKRCVLFVLGYLVWCLLFGRTKIAIKINHGCLGASVTNSSRLLSHELRKFP